MKKQKKLKFEYLDDKFVRPMKLDKNCDWNEKSLFDIFTNKFSDSCSNTKKNIELINILENSPYSSNLINFLKGTQLKEMINEYIKSEKFKRHIEIFKIKYNDEAAKEFKQIAKSYYKYYRDTLGNK